MKKLFLCAISILLIICLSVSVSAVTVVTSKEYPDYTFYVDLLDENGIETYAVNSYIGTDPNPVIPTQANTHTVQRLGEKCFYDCDVIETVTMHDGITNMRKWAMRNCDNLQSVYYSKNLAVIFDYALAYNPKMTTALLRNTKVTELYKGAFSDCSSLKYLSLPETLTKLDQYAFYKTKMSEIVLPDGIAHIGSYAFGGSTELKKIYIPKSVTNLSSNIFYNSPKVTVYCIENTPAHTYCINNNISFELIIEKDYPSNILGDVNNDKALNIRDATTIQKKIAGIDVDFLSQNCDTNADCLLNINDATNIQKYLVGFKDKLY